MAKSSSLTQRNSKGMTDADLLQSVDAAFAIQGYSPKSKIEAILTNSHNNFKILVRALVRQLLSQQDVSVLDKVIMDKSIRPQDSGWVSNVARLSERCIAEQIADELLATTAIITVNDLKEEVFGKLRELIDRRDDRQRAYQRYMHAVAQAQVSGQGSARIPPAIPHPDGFLPPSEAFPLTRLQPIRGQTVSADTKWIP